MTVPYNRNISSVTHFSSIKLLLRWRGSVWKCAWTELLVWMLMFYIVKLSIIACVHFASDGQHVEEQIVALCRYFFKNSNTIAIVMLLSFFVQKSFDRWQAFFLNIAYIEDSAMSLNSFVVGNDTVIKMVRRSVIRWLCLAQVLVYRDISSSVRYRFPTLQSVRDAGFLMEHEMQTIKQLEQKEDLERFWTPICWAQSLLSKVKQEGKIISDPAYVSLSQEIRAFRGKLATVYHYDTTPVPLAYPQVVSVAVRFYLLILVIAKQFNFKDYSTDYTANNYFPLQQSLECLFIVGWMKIGEALLNPLGEDDDDLELNYIIDSNITVGLSIAESHDHCPVLMEDSFGKHAPMYSEFATDLGGLVHRLQGSAVGMKTVAETRMVEVSPSAVASSIRKRNKTHVHSSQRTNCKLPAEKNIEMGTEESQAWKGTLLIDVPSIYGGKSMTAIIEDDLTERQSMNKSPVNVIEKRRD